ncbi:MAG: hypothetical protein WC227_02090 [Patescibacteria group bacterium]
MKKRTLIISGAIILVIAAGLTYLGMSGKIRFSASSAKLYPILVETSSPLKVTETSALLQGITSKASGGTSAQLVTVRGFQFGLSDTVYNTMYDTGSFAVNSTYTKAIGFTGLEPNTSYYVRAFAGIYEIKDGTYAGNQTGNVYGKWVKFQTGGNNVSAAIIQTIMPKGIEATTASLVGKIVNAGGKTFIGTGFDYGVSKDKPTRITTTSVFKDSLDIKDLSPGVTYFVRAFAGEQGPDYICMPGGPACPPFLSNDKFNTFGEWITFSTPSPALPQATAPKVTTLAPTNIGANSVLPHGDITSIGGTPVTKRGFKVSRVKGTAQADYSDTGSFNIGEFTKTNVNLYYSDTTYYIQAYATNAMGTTYGDWVEFKSLSK